MISSNILTKDYDDFIKDGGTPELLDEIITKKHFGIGIKNYSIPLSSVHKPGSIFRFSFSYASIDNDYKEYLVRVLKISDTKYIRSSSIEKLQYMRMLYGFEGRY